MDTGAFQNIAGSEWVSQMEKALKRSKQSKIEWKLLDRPHPVSGVGNDIVYAKWTASIPIILPGGGKTTYTCLYIDDNNCPGLLGMRALSSTGSILDLRPGKLCIYSGNTEDVEIPCRKGITKMTLEQAPSGHIMIPCGQFEKKNCRATSKPY